MRGPGFFISSRLRRKQREQSFTTLLVNNGGIASNAWLVAVDEALAKSKLDSARSGGLFFRHKGLGHVD